MFNLKQVGPRLRIGISAGFDIRLPRLFTRGIFSEQLLTKKTLYVKITEVWENCPIIGLKQAFAMALRKNNFFQKKLAQLIALVYNT
jgi:hypothetical protein